MKDIMKQIATILVPVVLFSLVVLYAYITKRPDTVLLFILLFFFVIYMSKTPTRIIATTIILFLVIGLIIYLKGESKQNYAIAFRQFTLTSNAFHNGSSIPALYTCDGKNISPQLSWDPHIRQKIESYILIVDDPDAQKVVGKTFVHWIVLLSGTTTELPEGISGKLNSLDAHARELLNHYQKTVYQGPCPPPGSGTHQYRFTLFATTKPIQTLELQAPCTAEECQKALSTSILAQGSLIGTYTRDK